MLRKFLHGASFGAGFFISILLLVWVFNKFDISSSNEFDDYSEPGMATYNEQQEWRNTSIDNKAKQASALVLLRFREEKDGLMAAYVEAVHKRSKDVVVELETGSRVEKSDYYKSTGLARDRNGVLVFYINNPAKQVGAGYIYDDRILGEADIPLELFIKKFNASVN